MDVRRRTMTLSDQILLATPDPAIRDFLKIPHDADDADDAVLPRRDANDGGVSNWKPLRDRLRLRRAANAWLQRSSSTARFKAAATTTTNSGAGLSNNRSNKYIYAPGEAAAAFSRAPSLRATPTFSRVSSTRVGPNSYFRSCSRRPPASFEIRSDVDHDEDGETEEDHEDEEDREEEEAPAAQMSLMALLEQTDSWDDEDEDEEDEEGGGGGARRMRNGGDDDEEDEAREEEEEMVHVCCVCMVRHKGAAFIPCGHTFCRLCSRELWVSRGNCPLCNGFIQEILDIF